MQSNANNIPEFIEIIQTFEVNLSNNTKVLINLSTVTDNAK